MITLIVPGGTIERYCEYPAEPVGYSHYPKVPKTEMVFSHSKWYFSSSASGGAPPIPFREKLSAVSSPEAVTVLLSLLVHHFFCPSFFVSQRIFVA
jgi:hypothetical protein